jgi:hypothetical protein
MAQMRITPEQCGDMLFAWLGSHCNSLAVKSVARGVGWKYSFFAPAKKVRLIEELTFLYISLAVHGTNTALIDHSIIQAVVDAFLTKVRESVLQAMAEDDEGFQERYSARVSSYFELLRSGGDAIGVAGDFLVGLRGTSMTRLQLQPSLKMATSITASQISLAKIFQQLVILKPSVL